MKRKISALLAALLLGGILSGCGASGGTAQTNAGMQLSPVTTVENPEDAAKLITLSPEDCVLGEYTVDDTLHAVILQRYTLDDNLSWTVDDSWSPGMYDPEKPLNSSGSLALFRQPDGTLSISVMNAVTEDGATAATFFLPDDAPEGTESIDIPTKTAEIAYGEEIPLLIRTITDSGNANPCTADDFADPSRFEGNLFTEAYTVTFSDTAPE